MPVPNTEGVESKPHFPPRPEGWYRMQFLTYETKSDKNGNTYTVPELGFEDNNQKVFYWMSNDSEWLWKLAQFKDAIGCPQSETYIEGYQGTRLEVYLKIDKYKNKTGDMVENNKVWECRALPDVSKVGNMPTPEPKDDLPF
jgi:hypothetical protein